MPQSHPARKALLARYNLYGDRSDMDPQGGCRFRRTAQKAQLAGEVKVSGEGPFLRVTPVKTLRERRGYHQSTPEMMDSLGDSGL